MRDWIKLHKGLLTNPKYMALTEAQRSGYIALLLQGDAFNGSFETEGQLRFVLGAAYRHVKALRRVGLLIDLEIYKAQEKQIVVDPTGSRRQQLFRDEDLRQAIRQRDGDRCRYCRIAVDWNDRRSARGGTYDHVDPLGGNELWNVVVACRGCNTSKGDSDVKEWLARQGKSWDEIGAGLDTDLVRSGSVSKSGSALDETRQDESRSEQTRRDETPTEIDASDEAGDEVPIQNPTVELVRLVDYVHGRGWIVTTQDNRQASKLFRQCPGLLAADFISLWESAKNPVKNPWAYAFSHDPKLPGSCTAVESVWRERKERERNGGLTDDELHEQRLKERRQGRGEDAA